MRDAGRIAWTAESLLARGPLAALSVFRRQNPANIELVIEDAPPAQEPAAHTGLDMQNKKLLALAIASLALPAIAAEAPAAAQAASTAAPVAAPASAPDSESEDALDSVVNGLASASETGEASPEGEKAEEARTDAAQEVAEGTAVDKTGAADAKSEEKNEDAGAGSADESGADGVAELRTADAVSPLAIVPPFLDFMPYVTSLKDVEEVFGKNARLYDDGRYGRRHIITGQDFDLGVTSILVYYTDGGLLSDVFLRIPAKERPRVLEALREMTPSMNPDGIWTSDGGRDYWRTKTAELSVGPVKGDDFTVEYGATARQIRETRAWIEADPAHRAPRFAGLSIGISTAADVKAKADGKRCRILGPSHAKDGSSTYALSGPCFGVPGEYQSLAWIAADSGRLTRLFLQSRGDAVGFSSVLPALEKRYRPTGKPGEFEAGEAPARNVWPAVIRFTPYRKAAGGTVEEGTLEFFAGIDGVKKEEAVWDALLEEKKAREAQARQVDSLFE